jgi:hypothetical protein
MLSKIKTIASLVWSDLKDTYNRIKIVLFAILALLVALEFQKLKEFLLVYFGQRELKESQKQDNDLANKETNDNNQANALVEKAKNESAEDDWNKK